MTKPQSLFWPKRPDIKRALTGRPMPGISDGRKNRDEDHWIYSDPNAVEVASVSIGGSVVMGWGASVWARPTTRGIQWALDGGEDGCRPLRPEFTKTPISGRAIMDALREAGLHDQWEYEEEDMLDDVHLHSKWYRLRL
jgi:hypothetical protein